jgi:hypothetical protein
VWQVLHVRKPAVAEHRWETLQEISDHYMFIVALGWLALCLLVLKQCVRVSPLPVQTCFGALLGQEVVQRRAIAH